MKKVLYWLWLICSILMIPTGIYAILKPAATLVSLAWLIGIILLVDGISAIAVFVSDHDRVFGAGWVLFDGIVTIILSLFMLGNSFFTAAALPFMFGMWIIVSGIQKAIFSFDLKKLGVKGWGWLLAIGILLSLLGVASFINPLVGTIAISTIVGCFLIAYGISSTVLWSRVNSARSFMKESLED
ncbi:MAG: DUF308 domain-containing protein [Oscillospiraceae bacterium]